MLEKDIVNRILSHLRKQPSCFCWKTHGGMYGNAGIPDIVACVDGLFVSLEVKQPGKEATALQKQTLAKIRSAGGVAHVVTSVEDVQQILTSLRASA